MLLACSMLTRTCNHWIFVSPPPAKAGRVPELTCQRLRKPTVRGPGRRQGSVCVATSRGRSSEPSRHKQTVLESSSRSVSPTRRHNKLESPSWSGYLFLGANPLMECLCRVPSSGTETPPAASGSLCCALLAGMTARGHDSDPRQTCSSKLRMHFLANRGEYKRRESGRAMHRIAKKRARLLSLLSEIN